MGKMVRELLAPSFWLIFRGERLLSPPPRAQPYAPADQLGEILARCARLSVPVFFIEMTRPEFAIPTFRALSTSLCHYKPRWGRQRLLQTGKSDWRAQHQPAMRPYEILLTI